MGNKKYLEQTSTTGLSEQVAKQARIQGSKALGKIALTTGTLALASGISASLATVGLAQYVVSQITKPETYNLFQTYHYTPYEFQADFEEVQFPTVGGRLLSGWFLPHANERRVIVTVSGYRGRKEDVLGIGINLWRNGYNVLMFNYRGYGGKFAKDDILTLGHRELQDFQAAVSFVRQRVPGAIVGAYGASMGAAVALVATARDPEIQAVWADSSFASQEEVIAHNFTTTTHLPSWPVVAISEKLFEWRTGHRYRSFEPVKEIAQIAPRPVFLVHGGHDSIIPLNHAYKLYEAAGSPKELWIDDKVDHCGIYFAQREEYWQRLIGFFHNSMKPETSNTSNLLYYNSTQRQTA